MSRLEATNQYARALKAGQKYCKTALSCGEYPYPPALDDMLPDSAVADRQQLGLIDIPAERIVGTKSSGRTVAFAGNFMPLLDQHSEFAAKWITLCEAHLGEEGIRDPIICYEYLGRFYVQEGNKRVSVLLSCGASKIPAVVTRLVPVWSEDEEIQAYYSFLRFFTLAGTYSISFRRSEDYARLQALLGLEPEQVWTEDERRRFAAGFWRFRYTFESLHTHENVTAAEAFLVWLGVFPFQKLREMSDDELKASLSSLWPDVLLTCREEDAIALQTEPEPDGKGFFNRVLGVGQKSHANVAFIHAFPPEKSAWVSAHEHGRHYMERALGERVTTLSYETLEADFYEAMKQAVSDGAEIIFATSPQMIDACRRIAATYDKVKVLNCALSQPYTGVRMYYSRMYECKFIAGIIAGAMAENDAVGYVANYPIIGTPTAINAFALGVRATNPRAKVELKWSCLPGNPLEEFREQGIRVISNRDATNSQYPHWALEWGTYRQEENGDFTPLAMPAWDWGPYYEKVVLSILDGSWSSAPDTRAVNYWWGMDTGVINLQLGDHLPDGVRSLAEMLRRGIVDGSVAPFRTRITDQAGTVRCTGEESPSPEELMRMDWLCDNVCGRIPRLEELIPEACSLTELLGFRHLESAASKEGEKL